MKQQNENVSGEETRIEKAPVLAAAKQGVKTETKPGKKGGAWKSVLIGGVPGIIFGVAGTLATEEAAAAATPSDDDVADAPGGSAPVHEVAPVASGVNDGMSFGEAFAAARAEVGPGGVFSWHGQVFGTYLKTEWDALDNEQQHSYSQSVANAHVEPDPYTPQPGDPHMEPNESGDGGTEPGNDPSTEPTTEPGDNPGPEGPDDGQDDPIQIEEPEPGDGNDPDYDPDVHIISVTQDETPDGDIIDVGVGTLDGEDATFLDLDGDGEVDAVVVDGNMQEAPEGISLVDEVATVDDYDVPDDSLYGDMPDYVNDADPSSLV